MKNALAAANEGIYRERQLNKQNEQMACVLTLALADVANNKIYYAHVGDTRLYLFRDSTLVKISHDHSFVGFLEDSGRLTEEEAMKHPKRNEINKALGFDSSIGTGDYIETGESPFLPGDIILLCSDGLSDMVNRSAMVSVLSSKKTLSAKAKQLVKDANEAGGKDNITVVLVHNNKPAIKQTATKPAANQNKSDAYVKQEVIDEKYVASGEVYDIKKKNSSGSAPIFTVLFFLLLAAFIWLLYQYYHNKAKDKPQEVAASIKKKRSEQEQILADSVANGVTREVFVLNLAGGQPVIITDSININSDTLRLIGNGVTLTRDSSYNGPAFTVSSNAKYILLDSLTLENFDIGMIVQNNAVHFRNVQFVNCRIPVQYNFTFPNNTPFNGRITDTFSNGPDTLSKQSIQ